MKRISHWIIIFFCLVLAAGFIFVFTYHRGSIRGKLTVKQGNSTRTYTFTAPGDYGGFEWTVGPKETPFTARLFNRNNWHVIDMDFVAEREESAWQITGTVNVKTYEPTAYEKTIPDGEPLVIAVDCFP